MFSSEASLSIDAIISCRIAMRLFMTDAPTVADNMMMMTMLRKTMITTMTMPLMMMMRICFGVRPRK